MSWLGGMAGLRRFQMTGADAETAVDLRQFSRLTALRDLHISGSLGGTGGSSKGLLPPSLTSLCIEGDLDAVRDLPPQVSRVCC